MLNTRLGVVVDTFVQYPYIKQGEYEFALATLLEYDTAQSFLLPGMRNNTPNYFLV